MNLRPCVLTDELRTIGGNPFLHQSCGVSVCDGAILLKDEATGKQCVTVCDKIGSKLFKTICQLRHYDVNSCMVFQINYYHEIITG